MLPFTGKLLSSTLLFVFHSVGNFGKLLYFELSTVKSERVNDIIFMVERVDKIDNNASHCKAMGTPGKVKLRSTLHMHSSTFCSSCLRERPRNLLVMFNTVAY